MKLTLVTNHDDWEALYVDGKCVKEGHRINWIDVINTILGIECEKKSVPSYEQHYARPRTSIVSYEDTYFPSVLKE